MWRKHTEWVLDTEGLNLLHVMAFDGVDSSRTVSNSIIEVFEVLGIEVRRCRCASCFLFFFPIDDV